MGACGSGGMSGTVCVALAMHVSGLGVNVWWLCEVGFV